MSKALAHAAARPGPSRFERLTRVYQSEIYPLFDHWFTEPLCAGLEAAPVTGAVVLDVGVGAGHLATALVAQKPALLVAMDPGGAMLSLALMDELLDRTAAFTRAGSHLSLGLPFRSGVFDRVFCRARADGAVDPWDHLEEVVRVSKPGARVDFTAALRGTWDEPLDLLDEALARRHERGAQAALRAYRNRFPAPETLAVRLNKAGLVNAKVIIDRKQVLFRSGREFFFSSLIELGPLRVWKAIVGKGEPLQAAFASVKDAIDTYYAGRSFTATACLATVTAFSKP